MMTWDNILQALEKLKTWRVFGAVVIIVAYILHSIFSYQLYTLTKAFYDKTYGVANCTLYTSFIATIGVISIILAGLSLTIIKGKWTVNRDNTVSLKEKDDTPRSCIICAVVVWILPLIIFLFSLLFYETNFNKMSQPIYACSYFPINKLTSSNSIISKIPLTSVQLNYPTTDLQLVPFARQCYEDRVYSPKENSKVQEGTYWCFKGGSVANNKCTTLYNIPVEVTPDRFQDFTKQISSWMLSTYLFFICMFLLPLHIIYLIISWRIVEKVQYEFYQEDQAQRRLEQAANLVTATTASTITAAPAANNGDHIPLLQITSSTRRAASSRLVSASYNMQLP